MALTQVRSGSAQQNKKGMLPPRRKDDESDYAHRQLIGYIGLVLPMILIILVVTRDGAKQWLNLDSISAYYYTGAVAAFVGMLVALALYLVTYRGYRNDYYWADRAASIIAAVAALGVAFFPTAAPAGVTELTWWTQAMGVFHYVFAVTLFSMFAVFALWLFRYTPEGKKVSSDRRRLNRIYFLCGLVIVASMIWASYEGLNNRSIFWPESVALIAFSVSWLVKGHAHQSIAGVARSMFRP